jgi:hypothetical protein
MATSMAKSLFNKAAVLSVELAPGLTKEVIRAGTGAQPARGAEVHAHYTGKLLDGAPSSSALAPRSSPRCASRSPSAAARPRARLQPARNCDPTRSSTRAPTTLNQRHDV